MIKQKEDKICNIEDDRVGTVVEKRPQVNLRRHKAIGGLPSSVRARENRDKNTPLKPPSALQQVVAYEGRGVNTDFNQPFSFSQLEIGQLDLARLYRSAHVPAQLLGTGLSRTLPVKG